MPRQLPTIASLPLLLLLMLAATLAPAGDRSVVENPAQPRSPAVRVDLEPQWRHGGLDDDEAFFGVIDAVAGAPDGRVYLADAQLMTVHVVSADGELLESLGRQGEGPGEVTRLGGVVPLQDGAVGLVQLMPGQVVKIDAQGLPAGAVVPRWTEAGGRLMLQDLRVADGGRLVAAGRRMTRGDKGPQIDQWIARLAPDGELSHFFYHEHFSRDMSSGVIREADMDWPGAGRWTVRPDGRVVMVPERNVYRLQVLGEGGVELEFGRDFVSRKRTPAEVAGAESRFQRVRRGRRGGGPSVLSAEVLPLAPDILALYPRPGGELWVQTSRSHVVQPDGVMLTYDVFDEAGNFTRQVSVACEGVAPRDALHPLPDGRFVLIIGHADALAAMRGAENAEPADDIALEVVGFRPTAQP